MQRCECQTSLEVKIKTKLNAGLAIRDGKGLIYLRPIFRLTKLAFLRARAALKRNTITVPKIEFSR